MWSDLAPRFVGEFQKGIDYIGDIKLFEEQLQAHQAIADLFGYKISFHSGSDKFSIFPSAARITNQRYHLKTAGTSWLEFVHLISIMDAPLFKDLYHFSLENLDRAKKSYHVNVTPESCPRIDQYEPENFRALLLDDNARQLLHINYGNILQHEAAGGPYYKTIASRVCSTGKRKRITRSSALNLSANVIAWPFITRIITKSALM